MVSATGGLAQQRLVQWRAKWLRLVQRFYWWFVEVDSLVLLNPTLRQAPNRTAIVLRPLKRLEV